MRFGIEHIDDTNRRAGHHDRLALKVRPMFEQRVLAVTEDIMLKVRRRVDDGRETFFRSMVSSLQHQSTVVFREASDDPRAKAPVLILGAAALLMRFIGQCRSRAMASYRSRFRRATSKNGSKRLVVHD
jgi:hypothetical protein